LVFSTVADAAVSGLAISVKEAMEDPDLGGGRSVVTKVLRELSQVDLGFWHQ
jgi:hypothetical protein